MRPSGAVARWWYLGALAAVLAVYLLALHVPPMDADAAEYAHLAREMLASRSFLVVHNRGLDYLDKPPLTFWLTSLSYALFGVSVAASKAPSILAALVAWLSVGKLAALDHGERAGWTAALLLASCQALFLVTNDCRTDTVLLGATAFTLWQLRAYQRSGSARALLLTGLGCGLALLAKGPIGAVVPAYAAASEIAASRDWKRFRSAAPVPVGLVALLVTTPMLVGLHRQFGRRGLTFFFWTQSFGRITGSNPWHNHTDPLFFAHTLLWAFLPWSPLFVGALLARGRAREDGRWFHLGGFVLTFVSLSLSHYKLPHYIFVALPFVAVLSARFVETASERASRLAFVAELVVVAALGALSALLATVVFSLRNPATGAVAVALFALALGLAFLAKERRLRLVAPALAAVLGANVVLAGHFYPRLLEYQAGSEAIRVAAREQVPLAAISPYRARPYSLDFALARDLVELRGDDEIVRRVNDGPVWAYTDEAGLAHLRTLPVRLGRELAFANFHVSMLKLGFLNPATRAEATSTRYLVELEPAGQAG